MAALAQIRGCQQKLRRAIHGNVKVFLDNLIEKQLEVTPPSSPSSPVEPTTPPDLHQDEPQVAPTHAGIGQDEPLLHWQHLFEKLHGTARDAHTIIFEKQGVKDAYFEGKTIMDEIEGMLVHINDIYLHTLTCDLERSWKGGKLAYQRKKDMFA